jgi:D-alanyl-D-alanine carboxypeptidase
VVVLGAPSSGVRTAMATALFDRGFMATSAMGSIATLNGFASSEPPDMHGKACYGRGRAAREYMAQVQRVTLPGTSNAAQQAAVLPERDSLIQGAKKKGKAMMVAAADTARAVFEPIAVYIGRAPGWSGPIAQARPANTPVGTPPPVTAYAPEAKPTMLDGSAPPIAASAADALPMRRVAEPVAKPTKVLATGSNAGSIAGSAAKPAAKPVRTAHVRHRFRIAHAKPLPAPTEYTRSLSLNESDKPMPGRHKKIVAAKPAGEEGDGGTVIKTAVKAKPARAKAKREKPPEGE